MSAQLCPLASGSLGNALLMRTDRTAFLVDMGLTQRALTAGLASCGLQAGDIRAVLVTHTHRDHLSGAAVGWCLRHRIPVYSTPDNLADFQERLAGFGGLVRAGLAAPIDGRTFAVGDVRAEAFDLPHDSPGRCLGFRFTFGPARARRAAAVATDLGHMPADALPHFLDCEALVLESNHDPEMLRASGRPWELIERIAGPEGHLSNGSAAEALAEIVGRSRPGRLRTVVLAHLSRDCNTPRLALAAQAHLARRASDPIRVAAAGQFQPGPMVEL
jgi:phosphoribosyl 1,2-cyclic phosphodiesterase